MIVSVFVYPFQGPFNGAARNEILVHEQTEKALIRLHICAVLSQSSVFASKIYEFQGIY